MIGLFYAFGLSLFVLLVRVAALFNAKAALWIGGRKNWKASLKQKTREIKGPIVWFHCASLGEFEQARPLIEKHKNTYRGKAIALSFFSPSGFEIQKNYPLADLVFYLPIDSRKNAKDLIAILAPEKIFFTKYEIWPNILKAIHLRKIPCILFSSNFRANQIYFKPWGTWFRKSLGHFSEIFVQNQKSKDLLQSIDINSEIAGDTRFDRVWDITKDNESFIEIETFLSDKKAIVVGSSWPKDEQLIAEWFVANAAEAKLIIAPHEIHESHIKQIEALFPSAVRWTKKTNDSLSNASVLIVDTIGILSKIYRYADVAYIGGGFGVGIHNTLEAAAFGCPLLFGPNYTKFNEAIDLIKVGAAFSVSNAQELKDAMTPLLLNNTAQKKAALDYVISNLGAADKILGEN
jgi:3-deoxy-D-manno-octulosonic-acid transferase